MQAFTAADVTTAEVLRVTAKADPDLPFADLERRIRVIYDLIEFGVGVVDLALPEGSTSLTETSRVRAARERSTEALRIRRLHYGSPIELDVALGGVISFIQSGGLLILLPLLGKFFIDSATAWKIVQEGRILKVQADRERAAFKALQKAPSQGVEEQATAKVLELSSRAKAQRSDELIEEGMRELLSDLGREVGVPVSRTTLGKVIRLLDGYESLPESASQQLDVDSIELGYN